MLEVCSILMKCMQFACHAVTTSTRAKYYFLMTSKFLLNICTNQKKKKLYFILLTFSRCSGAYCNHFLFVRQAQKFRTKGIVVQRSAQASFDSRIQVKNVATGAPRRGPSSQWNRPIVMTLRLIPFHIVTFQPPAI